jgi:hypothetical protein
MGRAGRSAGRRVGEIVNPRCRQRRSAVRLQRYSVAEPGPFAHRATRRPADPPQSTHLLTQLSAFAKAENPVSLSCG